MKISQKLIAEHGLSRSEYAQILEILGREPTYTELGIFSVMWSEHCSYKSSRLLLAQFPTQGKHVLQGPGENAGAVTIGDGLAAVFKMESHNHPSFIEPYQGAATGVGGILRDIFTMGARPVASLNSLHFGPLDIPKNRYLLSGVVAGIAGYGNCMGIPTVGGEVYFHESFNGNPIINVFSLGVVKADRIFLGRGQGVGNPVLYVGSKTGRDGIHGATMASEEFDETSEERRPTVQVGDPFTEKCLLEACQELMQTNAIVAIQDMGAAGLTCSTVEISSRGGVGMEIDLDLVPQRESMMSCYDLMLSESQERMLIVAHQGQEQKVIDTFTKWGLEASNIGKIIEEDLLVVRQGSEIVAQIPASQLTDQAPVYRRPRKIPARLRKKLHSPPQVAQEQADLTPQFLEFMSHPALASKEWIFEQYDHMVRTNTVQRPGSDSALIRIKGTSKALAMTVDSNPLQCYLDPYQGSINTVCEAARNLSASGAEPLALTDCLNFGNPERPDVMWEFAQAVKGIAHACRSLDIPVISGNVSFYNETLGLPIYPTPTIGMVGLIDDVDKAVSIYFKQPTDRIFLIGSLTVHLGASLYLHLMKGRTQGPTPKSHLKKEKKYQKAIRDLIQAELLQSAHDISDGGLASALAECCLNIQSPLGADIQVDFTPTETWSEVLFGEGYPRFIISCSAEKRRDLQIFLRKKRLTFIELGAVAGEQFRIADVTGEPIISVPVTDLMLSWRTSLKRTLEG
ncbi:phosphoribosylformylglycinamidine synthase subunit PurL [candidate division CSSED10-310 bacterium]|uniref:Phosphoribosylformylglycinamidine synthase subunit PurL n=1 Tax=candidate division CSSED10-310 bacterium TaxID=2855610 RepID=A0ABV6Z272_UNCC1